MRNGLSHWRRGHSPEVSFSSGPKRICEALTNADQFQKVILLSAAKTQIDVTTKPAEISRESGGTFAIFGGYISGRHIELVPNQRIVQAWHEKAWQPGDYSIARFELNEAELAQSSSSTTPASPARRRRSPRDRVEDQLLGTAEEVSRRASLRLHGERSRKHLPKPLSEMASPGEGEAARRAGTQSNDPTTGEKMPLEVIAFLRHSETQVTLAESLATA